MTFSFWIFRQPLRNGLFTLIYLRPCPYYVLVTEWTLTVSIMISFILIYVCINLFVYFLTEFKTEWFNTAI